MKNEQFPLKVRFFQPVPVLSFDNNYGSQSCFKTVLKCAGKNRLVSWYECNLY